MESYWRTTYLLVDAPSAVKVLRDMRRMNRQDEVAVRGRCLLHPLRSREVAHKVQRG